MDVDILSEEENPMLHRTDVTFELVHEDATPSRLQVRDSLAAKLNKDADEVVIRTLDTKFGMRKTVGYAKVYESAAHAAEIEAEHMLERNKIVGDGSESEPDDDGESTEPEATEEAAAEADEEDEDGDVASAEAEAEAEPEEA